MFPQKDSQKSWYFMGNTWKCFHGNRHPSSIKHPFISLYIKYQSQRFICIPDMNSPVFPSLDDIYCIWLCFFNMRFMIAIYDWFKLSMGVFLVTTRISIVPVKCDFSVNTDPWIPTIPQGSERSEWVSLWMERASEASASKWSAAERVSGVSGASERTKRATEWPFQNAIVFD